MVLSRAAVEKVCCASCVFCHFHFSIITLATSTLLVELYENSKFPKLRLYPSEGFCVCFCQVTQGHHLLRPNFEEFINLDPIPHNVTNSQGRVLSSLTPVPPEKDRLTSLASGLIFLDHLFPNVVLSEPQLYEGSLVPTHCLSTSQGFMPYPSSGLN